MFDTARERLQTWLNEEIRVGPSRGPVGYTPSYKIRRGEEYKNALTFFGPMFLAIAALALVIMIVDAYF